MNLVWSAEHLKVWSAELSWWFIIRPANSTAREIDVATEITKILDALNEIQIKFRTFLKIFEPRMGISEFHVVLLKLIAEGNNLTPTDLVEKLDLSKATITGHLNTLADNNLIQRFKDKTIDGRKLFITTTPKAEELLEILARFRRRVAGNIFTRLKPQVVYNLRAVMEGTMTRMDQKLAKVESFFAAQEREHGRGTLLDIPPEETFAAFEEIFPFLLQEVPELRETTRPDPSDPSEPDSSP